MSSEKIPCSGCYRAVEGDRSKFKIPYCYACLPPADLEVALSRDEIATALQAEVALLEEATAPTEKAARVGFPIPRSLIGTAVNQLAQDRRRAAILRAVLAMMREEEEEAERREEGQA